MVQRTITAFFDHRLDATNAVEKLADAGIARSSIRLLPEQEDLSSADSAVASPYDYDRDEKGFWATLGDMFMPEEDRATYAEGMHRGGTTVTVTVDEAHVDRAADILEEHGSVNMDERQESWRQEGWTGYSFAAGGSGSAVGSSAVDAPPSAGASDKVGTQTIPIVEEEMRVGKRQVEGGRVKVRSYVVETPVEEQVSLRQETVHVERRPVDRELSETTDADAFRDRTIDVEERDEEAVVSKEARVKEEVVVSKEVDQRPQTVSDKVRRTEVDIDDSRTEGSADRMTGTPKPRRG
jgi:uncharacterized protein (TIGR02271 family)